MKKLAVCMFSLSSLSICVAQERISTSEVKPDNTVTVNAGGADVRTVLYEIFAQAKKNFIADESTTSFLYLTMNNVPFEKAITIIARSAGLAYRVENEVYVFFPTASQQTIPAEAPPKQEAKKPDPSVFARKLSVELEQVDIRDVFAAISKQTNVPIEVATGVRQFKLNVYLIDTTLRFALNSITQAAGLMYTLTNDGVILITDPEIVTASNKTEVSAAPSTSSPKPCCDHCKAELGKGWKYCPHCGNYVKNITQ